MLIARYCLRILEVHLLITVVSSVHDESSGNITNDVGIEDEYANNISKASFRLFTPEYDTTLYIIEGTNNDESDNSDDSTAVTTTDSSFSTLQSCNQDCCHEEKIIDESAIVTWPMTCDESDNVISEPLCLDAQRQLLTRKCSKGLWEPGVIHCSYSQTSYKKDNMCPSPYKLLGDGEDTFCVLVSEPDQWLQTCLDSGSSKSVLHIDSEKIKLVMDELSRLGVSKVWLPARRWDKYDPIVWVLPGKYWNVPVELKNWNKTIEKDFINNLCVYLDMRLDEYTLRTADCSRKLPTLCVIDQSFLLQLTCPKGYYTTRYSSRQNICYGVEHMRNSNAATAATSCSRNSMINSAELNYIYENVLDLEDIENQCWMGLNKIGSKFVWAQNLKSLSYVNWSPEADFSQAHGAFDKSAYWYLHDDTKQLKCSICEKVNNKIPETTMVLKFENGCKHLRLTVYSSDGLWKESPNDRGFNCFTDAGNDLLQQVEIEKVFETEWSKNDFQISITNPRESFSSKMQLIEYKLVVQDVGSGLYWCAGHTVPKFTLIETPKISAYTKFKGYVFAVILDIDFKNCSFCTNVENAIKMIYEMFEDNISNLSDFRVMKILNMSKTSILLLAHVTAKFDEDWNEKDETKNFIKSYFKINVTLTYHSNQHKNYKFISMNSTSYCIPEWRIKHRSDILKWKIAKIGESVTPTELCLQGNGLPVHRKCLGDSLFGGRWSNAVQVCEAGVTVPILTQSLYHLSKVNVTLENSKDIAQNLSNLIITESELLPADIYYIGLILQNIACVNNKTASELEYISVETLAEIVSNFMLTNKTTMELSQTTLNSTNLVLDALDMFLAAAALNMSRGEKTSGISCLNGSFLIKTPYMVSLISNPLIENITGIALVKNVNASLSLTTRLDNFIIVPLTASQKMSEIVIIEGLEVATWVPQQLLDTLINSSNTTTNEIRVIVSIFYDDSFFQDGKNRSKSAVNSRVVSVTIPGHTSNLASPIPIILKSLPMTRNVTNASQSCIYWDFTPNDGSPGSWAKNGCTYVGAHGNGNNRLSICACSHLTHFAQLITGSFEDIMFEPGSPEDIAVEQHQEVLDKITLMGCSLSIVGVIGILTTALVFRSWREKIGTKVLLNLSFAIGLQMGLMFFMNIHNNHTMALSIANSTTQYVKTTQCVVVGSLLHYSVLAGFAWMLVIALLQYMRYVRVLGTQRPPRFIIKSMVFGWGFPIIPVVIVLLIDTTLYIPIDNGDEFLCYPTGYSLYVGVILPIAIMVLTNLIIFILVLYSILRIPDPALRTAKDADLTLSQLRLSILLFFLLGLSWIFGLAALTNAGFIFSYLFCLTATMQGFVLFIYFVICDPSTRHLWVNFVRTSGQYVMKRKITNKNKANTT